MSLLDALLLEEMEFKAPASPEFVLHPFNGKQMVAPFQRSAFFIADRADSLRGSGTPDDPWRGNTDLGPSQAGTVELAPVLTVTVLGNRPENGSVTVKVSTGSVAHELLPDDPITVFQEEEEMDDPPYERDSYAGFFGPHADSFYWPYDAATVFFYSSQAVPPTHSLRCQPWYARVTTAVPHGLSRGDAVSISGAPTALVPYLDRVHTVRSVTTSSFTIELDHKPGDRTTLAIPSNTSITFQKVTYGLEEALRRLPPHSTLFIGEGNYETRGNGGSLNLFGVPKQHDGQRIVGAGANATILKGIVAHSPRSHVNYGVIGRSEWSNIVDGFEICDLTTDCNMRAHPFALSGADGNYWAPYSVVTKHGVVVLGVHVRIRRVHAFDYCPQSPDAECFPISTGGSHRDFSGRGGVNCVIEECITEHPNPNSVRETTCVSVGGSHVEPFHRGCGVRNCIVDGRYLHGGGPSTTVPLDGLDPVVGANNTKFRVKTRWAHYFAQNANRIVYLGLNQTSAFAAGAYRLDRVHSDVEFDFESKSGGVSNWEINLNLPQSLAGPSFFGPGADMGTAAFVTNNRVFHVRWGYNHDTRPTDELVQARNYMRAVEYGAYQNLWDPNVTVNDKYVNHLVCERNVCEVRPSFASNHATGVFSGGNKPFGFRRTAITENYVRAYHDIPDEYSRVSGVVGGVKAVAAGNAFDLAGPEVTFVASQQRQIIGHFGINHPRSAENYSVSGVLARGWDNGAKRFHDFVTDVEDLLFITA